MKNEVSKKIKDEQHPKREYMVRIVVLLPAEVAAKLDERRSVTGAALSTQIRMLITRAVREGNLI